MQKKVLLPLAVVIVLGVGAVGYVLVQKGKTPVSQESDSSITTPENKDTKDTTDTPSQATEWTNYTSPQGISFKYPKNIVRVFDDQQNGYVYLTSDSSDSLESLQEKTKQATIATDGPGLGSLKYKQEKFSDAWNIAIKNIKSETELGEFIKDHYGKGCIMGSKEVWKQDGVYEIRLNEFKDAKGNDTSLDQAVCPVNYSYKILYAPQKSKALSLVLGQECTFTPDYCYYDGDISNSIEFN